MIRPRLNKENIASTVTLQMEQCNYDDDKEEKSRSPMCRYQPPPERIDNTTLVYIPVNLPCGVKVCCSPQVLSQCPMVLRSLQADLIQCLKVLPWSTHAFVKRTTIWVNASYSYGSRDNPRVLRHSTAHHQEQWLIHW